MSAVDVLAVLDSLRTTPGIHTTNQATGETFAHDLNQARAAVAELIEADKALADYLSNETAIAKAFGTGAVLAFRRHAAALARVQGGES